MHHVLFTTTFIVAETTQSETVSITSFCETTVLFLNVIPLQCSYDLCVCHLLFLSCFYITNEFHADFNYINLIGIKFKPDCGIYNCPSGNYDHWH